MTPIQFKIISKIDFKNIETYVFINKCLETTKGRFGLNSSMMACAGDGQSYRLERIISTSFQCFVRIPERGHSGFNTYTFDAGDIETLDSLKPLVKREPVLLNYDLEAERKMFD